MIYLQKINLEFNDKSINEILEFIKKFFLKMKQLIQI